MSTYRLKRPPLSPIDQEALRRAVAHYGFGSLNAFLEASTSALMNHYRNGDKVIIPLVFHTGKSTAPWEVPWTRDLEADAKNEEQS